MPDAGTLAAARDESRVEARLRALGVALPSPPRPSANYLPYVVSGQVIQIAGVAPKTGAEYIFKGKLGVDLTLEDGYAAARLCALNALSLLKAACNDLDRVVQIAMVRGFVNSAPDFPDIPRVVDGASDLTVAAFGERTGRHARTSIGCASLPSNVAVEIDIVATLATGPHAAGSRSADVQVPRYSWL